MASGRIERLQRARTNTIIIVPIMRTRKAGALSVIAALFLLAGSILAADRDAAVSASLRGPTIRGGKSRARTRPTHEVSG
jgi:hypothetical protein